MGLEGKEREAPVVAAAAPTSFLPWWRPWVALPPSLGDGGSGVVVVVVVGSLFYGCVPLPLNSPFGPSLTRPTRRPAEEERQKERKKERKKERERKFSKKSRTRKKAAAAAAAFHPPAPAAVARERRRKSAPLLNHFFPEC